MTIRTRLANLQKSGSAQVRGIGNGCAHSRTAKIYPMEELIRMSMATMIFLSDFMAERMFAPFSQVRSSGLVIPNL